MARKTEETAMAARRQFQQLGLLGFLTPKEMGQPLTLALDSIDEDPAQPRKDFDAQALQELADTIALRGVRQPISVRPHPELDKRWVLNSGARRLRASRLAGKTEIPAFVDTTADNYDQVIENEQREALKPMELALFVQRRMEAGDSQAEIARRLGKSRQYITYATALIDAPEWLLAAYRDGRCKGVTELYELRKLATEYGDEVRTWVSSRDAISRESVAGLRSELKKAKVVEEPVPLSSAPEPELSIAVLESPVVKEEVASFVAAAPIGKLLPVKALPRTMGTRAPRLAIELRGHSFELVVDKDPGRRGEVYVRPLQGGAHRVVSAADVRLVGFVED
jgi:ParB family transcriptional regulator, chromosome partitioning protein